MNKSNVAVLSGASTRGNHPDKVRAMLILLGCEVLVMTVWFSSTAVIPQISEQPGSTPFRLAALTSAVQVGFVLGTLLSALLRLADGLDPCATSWVHQCWLRAQPSAWSGSPPSPGPPSCCACSRAWHSPACTRSGYAWPRRGRRTTSVCSWDCW